MIPDRRHASTPAQLIARAQELEEWVVAHLVEFGPDAVGWEGAAKLAVGLRHWAAHPDQAPFAVAA